ncbi:MAG: MurR/RpiR family transcriptional regulator [Deltaproteobacteria bacterium]|jgi:DNA-binding MurR/RpiR family transcriptional regulator|nr:MurR/RpiR family transcriptional regulator [Deltaproteobacteria bacterium]
MDTSLPIIELLKEAYPNLSSKQGRLAAYLINHHKDAAFLNASALARVSGVSSATVTRLVYQLGFKGYFEFREALQVHARDVLSLPKFVPKSEDGFFLQDVALMEKQIIDEMLESIKPKQFNQVVQTLHKSKTVSVIGTHYNSMPAIYAAYYLQFIRPSVHLFTSAEMDLFTHLQSIGASDLALVISTARYPKDTQKIAAQFKDKGANIIAITDSPISPIIPFASQSLIVPFRYLLTHIEPYAGIMVLLHALVATVAKKYPTKSNNFVKASQEFMDFHDYHAVRDLQLD